MGTVTSRGVGRGCTVWLFTTLGECELSLSLGLLLIKTHSTNYKMRNNQCVCWASLELECRRLVVLSKRSCMGVRDLLYYPKRFCMGVRDSWRYPKFLYGCKRPAEMSKSSVAKRKHTVMFIT